MTAEQVIATPGGGIVYDASLGRKPQAAWFTREFWIRRHSLAEMTGGRGAVSLLRMDEESWVLRHYRRGGLIAHLSDDRYWWTGAARTRSFAEWRLLAELRRRELPVPEPIAAAYARSGLTYRADLITRELPASRTLATAIAQHADAVVWRAVGLTIARFHAQGVHHADLNANNILIADTGVIYLLDFDRGRLRARGAWEARVLERLRRSIAKISERAAVPLDEYGWQQLLEAYATAIATPA
jgi:3-deoxy-D-manno-octulosonic acid kinase